MLYQKSFKYRGYQVTIEVHQDEDMREPWKEHDGHGVVSGWETRDKRPGERVLNTDRNSRRFYDVAATLVIAKRDGWGLSDKDKAALAAKLGHKPTTREIIAEAVNQDFEHLRGWCNDEWCWLGYTTKLEHDGIETDGDSCWGYYGEDYMLEEATSNAHSTIDRMILTAEQTQLAECCP